MCDNNTIKDHFSSCNERFSKPFLSGFFAALASVFGKLVSSDLSNWEILNSNSFLQFFVRIILILFVVGCNAFQWRFYLHALAKSNATFLVIIGSLASNVLVASSLGYLCFEEKITSTWFLGTIFIMIGLALIQNTEIDNSKDKKKE